MARKIKIGDWVIVSTMKDYGCEVEVTGLDRGTDELIIRYVLDNGQDAYKTVSRKSATLFVE